jgi:hypothetical protein
METDDAGPSASAPPPPPPPPASAGADALAAGPPVAPSDVYTYVVTAHRPSAVAQSVTAALTGKDEINLVISKVTRMEIHKLTDSGLQGIADVAIYGRIACMRARCLSMPLLCRNACLSPFRGTPEHAHLRAT